MSMNYKEVARMTSDKQRAKFSAGIAQMDQLAESLQSQGLLPERFTPDKPKLHPSLESKALLETLTIGGRSKNHQLADMEQRGVQLGSYARAMMDNPLYTTSTEPYEIDLVKVRVGDMGIDKRHPTTVDIEKWRKEMGLDNVPAELAPEYRLSHMDHRGEWTVMSMEPITDSVGCPRLFKVEHDDDELWLDSSPANPDREWRPEFRFVFGLSKSENSEA